MHSLVREHEHPWKALYWSFPTSQKWQWVILPLKWAPLNSMCDKSGRGQVGHLSVRDRVGTYLYLSVCLSVYHLFVSISGVHMGGGYMCICVCMCKDRGVHFYLQTPSYLASRLCQISLSHLDCRCFDHITFPYHLTNFHRQLITLGNILLTVPKMLWTGICLANTLDAFVRYMHARGWEIHHKN